MEQSHILGTHQKLIAKQKWGSNDTMIDTMVDTMADAMVDAMVDVMVNAMVDEPRQMEVFWPQNAAVVLYSTLISDSTRLRHSLKAVLMALVGCFFMHSRSAISAFGRS